MSTAPEQFLWEETSFFEERYEKSASALIAIQEVLATEAIPVLSRKEFVQLYEGIISLPEDIFTQVWLDPTAYFWARNAYELTQLCLREDSLPPFFQTYGKAVGKHHPIDILDWHLQDFKRFVLAAHYLSKTDLSFIKPFRPRLPLAIPGTPYFLDGGGAVDIYGVCNGQFVLREHGQTTQFELDIDNAKVGGITLSVCPLVSHRNYSLPLQLYSFNLPAFDDSAPALEAGLSYQVEQIPVVQRALSLIDQYHHRTFAQLQDFIRLMAFKPGETGGYGNLSYSDLPGALICSAAANPYELAETLIHEFHHNRLFCIEEISPILLPADPADELPTAYYSPWRNDPRPLRGVLHALYVFTPVCEFWLNLYRSDSPEILSDALMRDYICSQMIMLSMQLQIGLDQLKTYGRFSEMGCQLFPAVVATVERLVEEVEALNLPDNAPMMMCDRDGKIVHLREKETFEPVSARNWVLHHIHTYNSTNQCLHWLEKFD